MDINYQPKNEVVIAAAQIPIITATPTAIIDFHASNQSPSNEAYEQLKKLRGNSQASLRFNIANWGSLTAITFIIYFYTTNPDGVPTTGDIAFQQTVSNTAATGVDTPAPKTIVWNEATFPVGQYSYDFPMMACDGIKITVQGTGTNTNSSLTQIHLALRTN